MRLSELMGDQPYRLSAGNPHVQVTGLAHDSRQAGPGYAFFCLAGLRRDGHDFAADALDRGAVAFVAEREIGVRRPHGPAAGPAVLVVPNSRKALALAASAYWGHPSSRLRVLAVTGTNGKTTVNHLLEAILRASGRATGLIGTVENRTGAFTVPSDLTTPDALGIQANLATMVASGLSHACIEVSSHALAGHRLTGCEVDVGILTNVARDHLDFHVSLGSYVETKLALFRGLGGGFGTGRGKRGPVYAVLNSDDPHFDRFRLRLTSPALSYGIMRPAHAKVTGAVLGARGSLIRVHFDRRPPGLPAAGWVEPDPGWPETGTLRMACPGRHNVRNLLAAVTAAWAEGCPWSAVAEATAGFSGVRGRWEIVGSPDGVTGVVDFAHNPDGLLQALETARLVARGRVILVFGCEGRKDRGKRPVMGAIAASMADHVILTIDNTFNESGQQILADIEAGLADPAGSLGAALGAVRNRMGLALPETGRGRRATYEIVFDRREAIYRAAEVARSGDLVMVAGRGHDAKLVFGTRVEILDDREVLREALEYAQGARFPLLPLDGRGRFGGHVVGHAVDPRDGTDDARGDALEEVVR